MNRARKIAAIVQGLTEQVEFIPGRGAVCPFCGRKMRVTTSRKWRVNPETRRRERVRFHVCGCPGCVLAESGESIRSVESKSISNAHPARVAGEK